MTLSLLATGHYFILDFYSNAYCIAVYCIVNRCFNMSFQQFHYPVGVDHSLPCSQARVIPDNYGFVSQLQTLELHLDTFVRLCRGSVASALDVCTTSQYSRAIDYAGVYMLNCYSEVMHNYDAIRVVDPWYLNSAVESLHGDLVQVDRNICSKLSSLWELCSNSVSQSRPSSRSLSYKVKLAEKVARGKAYISKRKAELLQEIDRQQLLESMSALVSTKSEVTTTGSSSVPLIVSTTCQSSIPSSTASSDQSCSSMSSAANDCKVTVPSNHNPVFGSSMPLDIPVVSTQCSSLDVTVSESSLVHSHSTHSLSQNLILDLASKDHLDCNHPQNSIHILSDCTESHNSVVFTQCPTELSNTVVLQEINDLDISPPLVSASDSQVCLESTCSAMQHVENGYPCDLDNLDLCHPPQYVSDVPGCLEIPPTDRNHIAVRLPAPPCCDVFESSHSRYVVSSYVVKFIHSSDNLSFVSLFHHCSLWFLIFLALVIYVVFLKRMKHRSGSSVKIKVCGRELF